MGGQCFDISVALCRAKPEFWNVLSRHPSQLILQLSTALTVNFGFDLFIRRAYSYSRTIPGMAEKL